MRLARMLTVLAVLAALLGAPAQAQSASAAAPDGALFDAEGYRIARYRSPVRADPHPAVEIDLPTALALEPGTDALFIDVMPVEGGVRDPASGVWTLSREHLTIPGALWYPETGRAPVDAAMWHALERTVIEARRAAPARPVILFCRADCWMSWNAARRLAASGIANISWLAEGTDGWHAAGRALVVGEPVAIPASDHHAQED